MKGLRPFCAECKQECLDGYWYEFLHGEVIICPDFLRLARVDIEDLEVY